MVEGVLDPDPLFRCERVPPGLDGDPVGWFVEEIGRLHQQERLLAWMESELVVREADRHRLSVRR